MKTLTVFLLFSSIVFAQNITIGSGYQLGKQNESFGATISPEVYTFNKRKVILRLYAGYYLGNNWGYTDNLDSHSRYEFGFESKNTMVTGKMFFNYFSIGYNLQTNQFIDENDKQILDKKGMVYSFGVGTRLIAPFSVMAKYVWGIESGIRLIVEYDLF